MPNLPINQEFLRKLKLGKHFVAAEEKKKRSAVNPAKGFEQKANIYSNNQRHKVFL